MPARTVAINHYKIEVILEAMKGVEELEQDIQGFIAMQNDPECTDKPAQWQIDMLHAVCEEAKNMTMGHVRSLSQEELRVLGTHTGAFERV
jgi:hypothetical protein